MMLAGADTTEADYAALRQSAAFCILLWAFGSCSRLDPRSPAAGGDAIVSLPSLEQTPTRQVWSHTWIELACKIFIYHSTKTQHPQMLWHCLIAHGVECEIMIHEGRKAIYILQAQSK